MEDTRLMRTPLHVLSALTLLAPVAMRTATHGGPPTLTIDNLRDRGTVHSGFIVGSAASSDTSDATNTVALVEVSLDGGLTFQAATGATNWKFKLPTGTSTWRDNSAHTITVRATDAGGRVSPATSISVRKGANQDVNGDGFADVLTGAPEFDNSRGRVYLFYSSPDRSGIASTDDANNLEDENVKVIGGEIGAGPQQFGASTATADVNGDGFADLIVGAPASHNGAGHIYVFYAIEVDTDRALVVQGNATGTSTQLLGDTHRRLGLGASVAAGDVTGDGVADVIAGAPGRPNSRAGEPGRAYVFHALPATPDDPAQGLIPATVFGANTTIVGEAAGTDFGRAVALGDVNGDGFSDAIIGSTQSTGTRGQVFIFHAATDGTGVPNTFADVSGVPATNGAAANTHIIGEETSGLGFSLTTGDLDGDGFIDVVAGGPSFADAGNPVTRGRVYVFYSAGAAGVPTNPVLDPNDQTAGQHIIGGEFGAGAQLFGASVAVGDVNGDGITDLIIGAPAALNGAGVAYIFHSSQGGLTQGNAINARGKGTQINGVGSLTSTFGISVSAGDVNGDGVDDAFGGASGSAIAGGRAFLFHGAAGQGVPGGINGTIRVLDATTTLVGAPGTLFGFAIAR